MSQRVTISIQDDLFDKLQTFKDRLNISRICQWSISEAISLEETKDKIAPDIENLAVRLRKEKQDICQKIRDEGFEDGIKDANEMGLEEIYILQIHQDEESPKELFSWSATQRTREKIERKPHEEGEKIKATFFPFLFFDEVEDIYYRGWLDGVLFVWKQVRGELKIY